MLYFRSARSRDRALKEGLNMSIFCKLTPEESLNVKLSIERVRGSLNGLKGLFGQSRADNYLSDETFHGIGQILEMLSDELARVDDFLSKIDE